RDRRAVHGLGRGDGLVAEAAGEGLRQQHQVGDAAQRRNQLAVVLAVAGRVVPASLALDEADAEVVHSLRSLSMAASSVDSLLAKHSRASRWPSGGRA